MPDISLLAPKVLNGVIEELQFPDTFLGLSLIGTPEDNPFPVAEWDVIGTSRAMAQPGVPNTEAKIVSRLGVGKRTASFLYLREKKIFKPTTLHWLREPGTLATKNAERAVMREIQDLDRRFAAFAEWTIWQMLSGVLSLNYADVIAEVDYALALSHTPVVAEPWSDAGAADVIGDIFAWKLLISEDGAGGSPRLIVLNSTTMNDVVQNESIHTFFSDRMKDSYLTTQTVPGLLGLEWRVYDSVYDSGSGAEKYVPDGVAILIADNPERPFFLMQGPSADHSAPTGHVGRFAKSWLEEDPSARQYLEEWHFLPILERPDQIVYAHVDGSSAA